MLYVQFFCRKKCLKEICSKGTSNVLQWGGVSGVWSNTTFLHFFGLFPKRLSS